MWWVVEGSNDSERGPSVCTVESQSPQTRMSKVKHASTTTSPSVPLSPLPPPQTPGIEKQWWRGIARSGNSATFPHIDPHPSVVEPASVQSRPYTLHRHCTVTHTHARTRLRLRDVPHDLHEVTVEPPLASLADLVHLTTGQIYFYESLELLLLPAVVARRAAGAAVVSAKRLVKSTRVLAPRRGRELREVR